MFEKAMLKEPFENLFRRVVNDVKQNRYKDKMEELAELESIMNKLLSDVIRERFNKLRSEGKVPIKVLQKREKKAKDAVFSLLAKKLRKMRRGS